MYIHHYRFKFAHIDLIVRFDGGDLIVLCYKLVYDGVRMDIFILTFIYCQFMPRQDLIWIK